MRMSRRHVLIVGCGYVGQRLALRLQDGFRRHRAGPLGRARRGAGARRASARWRSTSIASAPARAIPERLDQEAIVYLTPPPVLGESDLRLDRFLQLATVPPHTFVYMSTTGVYGDTAGAVVDESSAVQPRTDRARRRVSAEEMTRVWCTERHVRRVVLRVPGIYGPDRLPLERLRHVEPVVREREAGISNRIHVDDLVEACARCDRESGSARRLQRHRRPAAQLDDVHQHGGEGRRPAAAAAGLDGRSAAHVQPGAAVVPERIAPREQRRMLKHLGVELKYADVEAGIKQRACGETAAVVSSADSSCSPATS